MSQHAFFFGAELLPVCMPCDACGELRDVQASGYFAFHPCAATFTEKSEGHATECCRSAGEPFKPGQVAIGDAKPKRIAEVTLSTPRGRLSWRLSKSGRAWQTRCPGERCGRPIFCNTNALRPGAVQCGYCKGWVPSP